MNTPISQRNAIVSGNFITQIFDMDVLFKILNAIWDQNKYWGKNVIRSMKSSFSKEFVVIFRVLVQGYFR